MLLCLIQFEQEFFIEEAKALNGPTILLTGSLDLAGKHQFTRIASSAIYELPYQVLPEICYPLCRPTSNTWYLRGDTTFRGISCRRRIFRRKLICLILRYLLNFCRYILFSVKPSTVEHEIWLADCCYRCVFYCRCKSPNYEIVGIFPFNAKNFVFQFYINLVAGNKNN
jgi:hypothetical protein